MLVVLAVTTELGRLFHIFTTVLVEYYLGIGGQVLASCLHTLPPQFLSSKKLGYKKGVFGA